MDIEGKLRSAAQSLAVAESVLRKAADAYPFLDQPGRAFRRMATAANRPLRIGILGELNSGKSSLANLLVGVSALPADPVANTRLPALLKYSAKPSVTAVYESGERIAFPVRQSVAEVVAAIQETGGKSNLPAGKSIPPGNVKILEVGLPSEILRTVEILDFPVGHRGMPGHRMDAAIWTTVATQAWRESERAQWVKVQQAPRSRSLLAVTFCDLVAGKESNLKRLQARLETSAKPHFRGICFVENGGDDLAAAASKSDVLFTQVQYLAQEFAAERLGKAMAIARRVMTNAIGKLGHGTELESTSLTRHTVAEASRGLFDGDWVANLSRPLPQMALKKPSILRSPPASGAEAKARRAWAAGENTGGRSRWVPIGAAVVLAGAATLVAIQLGLFGPGASPEANPVAGSSEAVEQSAQAEVEKRRKEAEAAAAEARRKAQLEAAAAEERRKAEAEAAAAEARWKAGAEAAAAEGRRKTEARRKAEAEAAAAEARRKAEAEAAAAEVRRKAEAETAAALARRKAEAEAAAAEASRKAEAEAAAAEARSKAEAEAVVAEARRKAETEAAAAEARIKAEAEVAAAEARRKAEAEVAAAEARSKAEAEAAAAESEAEAAAALARKKAEAEAAAAEARRKAEAEAVAAEARREAEAEAAAAAQARKKAEAAAAEAKRRKKAEAEAAEAEKRRRAEAEEAERRRRAADEAPHRSGSSSPIMHGVTP